MQPNVNIITLPHYNYYELAYIFTNYIHNYQIILKTAGSTVRHIIIHVSYTRT